MNIFRFFLFLIFSVFATTGCNQFKNPVSVETEEAVLVTGFEINPKPIDLQPGAEIKVKSLSHYSDGSSEDVTAESAWDIDDRSIAVVDANGMVTAIKNGQTILRSRNGGLSDECLVKVNGPEPGKGSLSFKVEPIETATITVVSFTGDTMATGYKSGTYLSNLDPGDYWVWGYAKDYDPNFVKATVLPDADTYVEFGLDYADPTKVTVSGTIRPIGAQGTLVNTIGDTIEVGSTFVVSGLKPEVYFLYAYKEGHKTTVSDPIDATTPGRVYTMGMDLVQSDPTTGSISGTIIPLNSNSGAYISNGYGKTVAEGLGATFAVSNLEPGSYWVTGVNGADNLSDQTFHVEVKAGENVHVRFELKKKETTSPARVMLFPQDQNGNHFTAYASIKDVNGTEVFAGTVPGDKSIALDPESGPHFYTVFDSDGKWVAGGINSQPGSVTFHNVIFNYDQTTITVTDTVMVTKVVIDTVFVNDGPVPDPPMPGLGIVFDFGIRYIKYGAYVGAGQKEVEFRMRRFALPSGEYEFFVEALPSSAGDQPIAFSMIDAETGVVILQTVIPEETGEGLFSLGKVRCEVQRKYIYRWEGDPNGPKRSWGTTWGQWLGN